MRFPALVCQALANAFALGPWNRAELLRLGRDVLGEKPRWLAPLVHAVLQAFPQAPAGEAGVEQLVAFIASRASTRSAWRREPPHIRHWSFRAPVMGLMPWPVPPVATLPELARLLELDVPELEWLADTHRYLLRARAPQLSHYHRRWLPKASGGHRLIETPKPRIKAAQRMVLRRVLDAIPPHPCAEGFVRGRSARSHAARHAGRAVVLCLDLEDFFTSIPYGRVLRVFRGAGYPLPVARALAGLCTTALPLAELGAMPRPRVASELERHERSRRRALSQHLPQGAPTSPALANLCALALDRRLSAAAAAAGLSYSRYADDLAFSGEATARSMRDFATLAAGIALDAGFGVNFRKTRVMPRATRQHVCGLVVNAHPNVARDEYDRLKSVLTNCRRHGVSGQNRDGHRDFRGHLQGSVGWVEAVAPARGAKLRALFDAIEWPAAELSEPK